MAPVPRYISSTGSGRPCLGARSHGVAKPEVPTTIRLSADVIEYFKLVGRGWRTQIDLDLRERIKHRDTVRVAALSRPA